VLVTTAALVAAVVVCAIIALPPAQRILPPAFDDGTVPGVLHIHTIRSDGRGTLEEVAAAAARAGLKFIVLTDHGDATRRPDPPAYRSGVLCIDAVEISTTGGHYIALGLPQAPYPLGGEPRDVVEDVKRLGGFGIAAHPDSPKPELQWRAWDAPFDAMEIINPDSGWRRAAAGPWRERVLLLDRALTYPIRPAETIASFVTDPRDNSTRWDELIMRRNVVGVAGADVHSKLALTSSEPGAAGWSIPAPSYEAAFRTMSEHVMPSAALTGNAADDAKSILTGIRHGHLYIAMDAVAKPPSFTFSAAQAGERGGEGDEFPPGAPLVLRIRSNAPSGFTTTVERGGQVVASSNGPELTFQAPSEPAAYRAEIHATNRPGSPVWILSNPIYVRGPADAPAAARPATSVVPIFDGRNVGDWQVEHDSASTGSLDAAEVGGETAIHFRYTLAASPTAHASVALLRDLTQGVYGNTRVSFSARADRPMRISVQLRTFGGRTPQERWQRSVYVDTVERDITVDFADMRAAGDTRTPSPVLNAVGYVMFVVDGTNTPPGASGELWVKRIDLAR